MNLSIRKSIIGSFFALCVILLKPGIALAQGQPGGHDMKIQQDCTYWLSLVDGTVERNAVRMEELQPDVAMKGIACLLSFQGNKNGARFSGALDTNVSRTFPETTAEVAALYYASYLFHQRFDHARAVALVSRRNQEVNTDRVIRGAFEAYRRWFKKLKRIGLTEARRIRMEPLKGTDFEWY